MTNKKHYVLPRPYIIVGEYLAEKRQKAGLTQREVSLALDYSSPQFISNFERGIALPPLRKLRAMVRMYSIPEQEFLDLLMGIERSIMQNAVFSKKAAKSS